MQRRLPVECHNTFTRVRCTAVALCCELSVGWIRAEAPSCARCLTYNRAWRRESSRSVAEKGRTRVLAAALEAAVAADFEREEDGAEVTTADPSADAKRDGAGRFCGAFFQSLIRLALAPHKISAGPTESTDGWVVPRPLSQPLVCSQFVPARSATSLTESCKRLTSRSTTAAAAES